MVATPGGMRPKSQVHVLESGYRLSVKGGHVLKINAKTGKMIEDFGESRLISNSNTNSMLFPDPINVTQPSWVTWAQGIILLPAQSIILVRIG